MRDSIPLHTHCVRLPDMLRIIRICLLVAVVCGAEFPVVNAQSISFDRDRGRTMLAEIKSALKKNYYDPNIRGMDVDARFRQAEEEIKQATSLGQITGSIAQALLDLNDSHTFFLPPQQATSSEYGWQMQIIGQHCYVTAVKPGSDAEAKGLKPGDRIITVNNFKPTRADLWKMNYYYNALSPQPGLRLVVLSPGAGATERQLDIAAKVKRGAVIRGETINDWITLERESENESRLHRHRFVEMGDELLIWKMPQFDLPDAKVDDMMSKAKNKKALILDLRGNGGGYVTTLQRLVGNFFDHDVKIGDVKSRTETKPLIAKTRGSGIFKGDLVVLVDSDSGSAAELFARVVQLEKRGTIIGDRTAGAVMRSRRHSFQLGVDRVVFYGVSITDADIIMTDGKSLEGVGVMPDKLLVPIGKNLAAQQDPVLVYAGNRVGVPIDPSKAGEMFPVEWVK